MSTITERVAAGAAFLDEHDPEWWRADVERAIDLEALNAAALGFQWRQGDTTYGYQQLTAQWAKVITERRSA